MPIEENTKIRVFIDESGHPEAYDKTKHQIHDKYFTIASVLISQSSYKTFKKSLNLICEKYSKYLLGKEIKSNYIRCSNPKTLNSNSKPPAYIFYKFWRGQNKYDNFCKEIKDLIKETDFKIISVTVDKENAGIKYPHLNFHYLMLYDLWERISIYYVLNNKPNLLIVFDRTKNNADLILKDTYKIFKEKGSYYWGKERLDYLNLTKDVYSADSEKSRGLQLVDLCAYPIKKQLETKNHLFYEECIKDKVHKNALDKITKKTINMGCKKCLR